MMMRAVVQSKYADAGTDFSTSLELRHDHPIPVPDGAKGEVRVRVAFAATNAIDYKFLRGDLSVLMPHPFPCPAGRDFSGILDTVPAGVELPPGVGIGDRVCGYLNHEYLTQGSMAEFVVCRATCLAKVPLAVPLHDAAALPLVSITAYVAVAERLELGTQSSLLVLGGSSATGLMAMQLARERGCRTIACTSTAAALCAANGATEVIDYRDAAWWDVLAGRGFDAVFDAVGGPESYEASAAVLKPDGVFYTIVGDTTSGKLTLGGMIAGMCAALCRGCCGGPKYQLAMNLPDTASHGLVQTLELAANGRVRAVLDGSTPFQFKASDAAAMLAKQESGRCKGKLVMAINADLA